ncbi:OSM1 [Candida pseudojiufengensis]|uniref:OSM1 n=1 Tax=Candida pseudojiufengensis TaxID=497109 RepID=UPI0022244B33|nr:OSM1 [Candida pseudojiufengensis]KAI5959018.1 OSM1 [Candida pseudojiufengensis]
MNQTIVVGSGLAGLTSTLSLLQRNQKVILIEKTNKLGGNSIKASSGINGVPTSYQNNNGDTVEFFKQDSINSGKGLSNPELVSKLTSKSRSAIEWLTNDLGIDLSIVTQLGGHSYPRAHRGSGKLPPGFAIVSALIKKIEEYQPNVTILKQSKLIEILKSEKDNEVIGIKYTNELNETKTIYCNNLILATGGFSADTENSSLISKYRPDLINFPSSNGQQTTGDGIKIAEKDLNVKLIHMNKIQIHPTGFLNVGEPNLNWKILCGELMRGIGGILLNLKNGNRFINELETRDVVTDSILKNCKIDKESNELGLVKDTYISVLVISDKDYPKAHNHIDFYLSQDLLQKGNLNNLLNLMKKVNPKLSLLPEDLKDIFNNINTIIKGDKQDPLGRKSFGNQFLDQLIYFGLTTPVLHYSMGGIEIVNNQRVLQKNGKVFKNLYAIGEVSGGLHGENRLGGNSLLECVVFGREVSDHIVEDSV